MAIDRLDLEEARRILDGLREARERSAALRRRLPEVADAMLDLEVPYTPEAELALALEGVALDLAPLIERLEVGSAATPEQLRAEWQEARRSRAEGELLAPRLDLGRFSELARRAIYEDVVRSRFDLGPSPLTPDDFELQVLYLFGRWMVVYRKLWEVSDPLVPSPQGLLMVGLDERSRPTYLTV
ncbi:MAG: hypothetical protein ACJ76N_18020 [Thermoanaerobaculia bacterium]